MYDRLSSLCRDISQLMPLCNAVLTLACSFTPGVALCVITKQLSVQLMFGAQVRLSMQPVRRCSSAHDSSWLAMPTARAAAQAASMLRSLSYS